MSRITTGKVRFSFVHVFQPYAAVDGAEPRYSVTILIPKNDKATLDAVKKAMEATLTDAVSSVFGGQRPANPALPLYDGDGLRPNGEEFGPECKGHYVMTAASKQPPEVVDAACQSIISESEVYSGCFGRISLNFFAYNKAGRKGIGCGLGNVQKLEDGEHLGNRTTAAQDFGAAASEFSADAMSILG